jgi:hypothetical protein
MPRDRSAELEGKMSIYFRGDSEPIKTVAWRDKKMGFAAMLDRERDIAYREHLFADHDKALAFEVSDAFLEDVAVTEMKDCETCARYAAQSEPPAVDEVRP